MNCSNSFLDPSPRIIKTNINKWNLIKPKTLHNKGDHKVGEPTKWEKIFANGATDKGLISKI